MTALSFNDFVLDTTTRTLAYRGETVQIGSRAFDILAALSSRAGEIVTKQELIDAVWPDTHVDEGALRVHMVALRRALEAKADGRIVANVPGKGYMLAARIEETIDLVHLSRRVEEVTLPVSHPLFGRGEVVSKLQHESHRLLTIAGPGGVGKTAVALAIGTHARDTGGDVKFVDLNGLSDTAEALAAIIDTLGLKSLAHVDVRHAANYIGDRELTLIFDGCERAVDDLAVIAERLLQACPGLKIIATSREPLRAIGERVRFLGGLELPGAIDSDLSSNPAVRLFVDRASASGADIDLADADVLGKIATVVSRLDGLPLAIELAAGRLTDLGVDGILDGLSQPLEILKFGRRTAPERHKSFRACMAWGLALLDSDEFAMLSKLSREDAGTSTHVPARSPIATFAERDVFDRLIGKSFISPAFAGNEIFNKAALAHLMAEVSAVYLPKTSGNDGVLALRSLADSKRVVSALH